MKAKKWLTIITGCISLLSLIAALIIGKTSNCILYDISMAIFGSALLGAIMSLTEYFVERRKAMEQFWDEARKVLKELRKIRYINVDAPHDLICACFSEEESNKWHEKLDHIQAESARNNLISWFEENTVMSFTEEDDIWCGEFRGKYRGVSCSTTLGIIVVLTSDYMYVLDIYGGEIMEYYSQPEYVDITVTPFGKILVTDGYGIEMFANTKVSDMENIVLPINADNLKFVEWRENILKISCFEFLTWGKEIELYLNFETMEWLINK